MKRIVNGRINLVAVGNSLTAGNNPGIPWPTQALDLVGQHVSVTNQGYPAQTSTYLLSIYESTLRTFLSSSAAQNIMVISEVRNEMGYGATPRAAVDALWALVDRARRGGWIVWVCTIIDTNPIGFTNGDRLSANALIQAEAAQHGASVIDLAAVPALSVRTNLTYFHTDEIHLTTAGYRAWAEAVLGALGLLEVPALVANILFSLRAQQGLMQVSGEASGWSSPVLGGLTLAGAVGQRPEVVALARQERVLRLNGASDRLTFTALGALGQKVTVTFWVKVAATIQVNDTLFTSGDLSAGYLHLATFNGTRWLAGAAGSTAGNMNGTVDGTVRPGVWQFVAVVFDGTQAAQADRLKIYMIEPGEVLATLQGQVPGGTLPTSITAGGGQGALADLVGFSRQLPGDMVETRLYTEALTPAQLVAAAKIYNPLRTVPEMLGLGDSITLGVGDNPVDTASTDLGGYRGRLPLLANDMEAWWWHGHIQSGYHPNNRCAAVGGSRIDEHLTQWNTAIAAGAAPRFVFYMGGRNDFSQGASLATVLARWVALFDVLVAHPTVERVFVSTIVPESTNGGLTKIGNRMLKRLVRQYPKITLVDGFAAMDYATDLYDSVHPNSSGYWKLAQVYYDALLKVYRGLSKTWRNPIRLPNLRGWWDASVGLTVSSGQDVATLRDARGQGRTLTKTNDGSLTASPQRLAGAGKGGRTVVTFGPTTAPLQGSWLASDWAAGDSLTLMVAAQIREGASGTLVDLEPGTTTNQGIALFREFGNLRARRIATDAVVADTDDGWRVLTGIFTPSSATLRVNGQQVATSGAAVALSDLNNIRIGSLFGAVYPLTGQFGELVICKDVLPDHEILQCERYLAEKWVGATLPGEDATAFLLDPLFGVESSGGVVSSWAARIGTAVFSGVGTSRPALGPDYLEFDGTDDFLDRVADAQTHPAGLAQFTWCGWVRRSVSALSVVYSSMPFFTGTGGILVQDNSNVARQYYPNATNNWNLNSFLALNTWVFRAMVYDSTQALGARLQVYEGTTPASLALVTPGVEATVGTAGAASGNSNIGRDAGLGRYFGGRLGMMALVNRKLTLAELKQWAAFRVPA